MNDKGRVRLVANPVLLFEFGQNQNTGKIGQKVENRFTAEIRVKAESEHEMRK